jgi:hypothetical protein
MEAEKGLTPAEQREVSELLNSLNLPDLSKVVQSPVGPQRAARPTAGNIAETEIERRWRISRPKQETKPVKHPGREAHGDKAWMG